MTTITLQHTSYLVSLFRRLSGRLGRRGALGRCLLLLLVGRLVLVTVALLGVPLASLQNQDTNEDKGKNGVASRHDAQAVFLSENELAVRLASARRGILGLVPDAIAKGAQAAHDVGHVGCGTNDVEDQRGTVKEEVGFGGTEKLDDEAGERDKDHDVEHAADERRGGVHEPEVRFKLGHEFGGERLLAP